MSTEVSASGPAVKPKKALKSMRVQSPFGKAVQAVAIALLLAGAAAFCISRQLIPVLQICGSSMEPTLQDGDILLCIPCKNWRQGHLIAFYSGRCLLVKRVIGLPGDRIELTDQGAVKVNGERLQEPYAARKSLGRCDVEFPMQVPQGRLFVLGDHRTVSVDSRSTAVGCVQQQEAVARPVFRVWPLNRWGAVE